MKLAQLKKNTPNKIEVRVGRGGKRGKTSGRGTKGQFAHGGHGVRAAIKDVIRKYPKLRGRGLNLNKQIGPNAIAINLKELDLATEKGSEVTFEFLKSVGLVPKSWKSSIAVKILAEGAITKAISVQKLPVSAAARDKIVAAGGSVA
jgi:large subunit ribosomal protein L15